MAAIQFICGFFLLCAFTFYEVYPQASSCRRCLTNGIYSLDERRYHRCINNRLQPNTRTAFSCPQNQVPTIEGRVCVDVDKVNKQNIACRENSACGQCPDGPYDKWPPELICISPTEYKACEMIEPHMVFKCEEGMLCNHQAYQQTGRICVPRSVMDGLDYAPTCKPSPADINSQCQQYEVGKHVQCFTIRDNMDSTCQSFIHCKRNCETFTGTLKYCDTGFYNQSSNKCESTKRPGCGDENSNPF